MPFYINNHNPRFFPLLHVCNSLMAQINKLTSENVIQESITAKIPLSDVTILLRN